MNRSSRSRRQWAALAVPILAVGLAQGCAHRRRAYDSADLGGPGVHVRAPFVNVQVQGRGDRDRNDEISHRDDDDDDRDRD